MRIRKTSWRVSNSALSDREDSRLQHMSGFATDRYLAADATHILLAESIIQVKFSALQWNN